MKGEGTGLPLSSEAEGGYFLASVRGGGGGGGGGLKSATGSGYNFTVAQ